jgi:hypothetical protein
MLVSLVMRRVINLIHQGTSPIVQEQNGLPLATHSVEIGEKSPIHPVRSVALRVSLARFPRFFQGLTRGEVGFDLLSAPSFGVRSAAVPGEK